MNVDGNLHALNKHLDEVEAGEVAQEHFESSIQDELLAIDEAIGAIRNIAENYEGYDFSDLITELVGDLI